MEEKITFLNKKILTCTKCKRLVNFRQKIAKEKREDSEMKITGVNQ